MKALLLVGNNDAASSKYTASVAKENDLILVALQAKEFPRYEKQFFTSTLDSKQCLFHLTDAHTLRQDASKKLFEFMNASPHRFILSGNAETPWFIKMGCIVKSMDASKDEFTSQLQVLLTESNRTLVREKLEDADLVHLFHVLKYGAWRNPESLEAMLVVSQNLYKVKRDYLLSLLSWVLPAKPYTFASKKQVQPLESSIMKKIEKLKPSLTKSEHADMFLLLKACKDSIDGLELSEEEEKFLGIEEKLVEPEQAVFCRSIEEFF